MMWQRALTLVLVALASGGLTILWPRPAIAATAERLEVDAAIAELRRMVPNATAPVAAPATRAVVAPKAETRERADVQIRGPAECLRRIEALRTAFAGPLDVTCVSDRDALRAVASGAADAAVVTIPFERELPDANLRELKLGDFVLALVRHDQNPVLDLSRAQLDDLRRGRVRGWQDLGGRGTEVRVFSAFAGPADEARALNAGQGFTVTCERSLSALQVIERVRRERTGLGVVALRDVPGDLPTIAIDGVQPSAIAFATGSYPYGYRLRIVYRAEHRAAVAAFLTFASKRAADAFALPE